MIVRTIQNSLLLHKVQLGLLDPQQSALATILEHDMTSSLRINGVPIQGFGVRNQFQFVQFLTRLCQQLGSQSDMKADELVRTLLFHIAPSSNAKDVFFLLNATLGCPDLMLQAPKTAATLPTDLKIYSAADSGHIQAEITTKHPFGLFRKSDLTKHDKRPWIRLIADVRERVNLTNGESVRECNVNVYDKN
jgi:hypothetical protein